MLASKLAAPCEELVKVRHPLFGDRNLYEWPAATVRLHERNRQGQIREPLPRLRG